MRKSFNSLALLALTGAAMMSSCSKDTDLYDSSLAQKEYEQNWTEMFGQVASDQDWNLATRATATMSITEDALSKYSLQLFTANPLYDENARIIANYEVETDANGYATVTFNCDIAKSTTQLYAVRMDSHNRRLVKLVDVTNGTINASFGGETTKAGTRAAVETIDLESATTVTCPYTVDGINAMLEDQSTVEATTTTINHNGNSNFCDIAYASKTLTAKITSDKELLTWTNCSSGYTTSQNLWNSSIPEIGKIKLIIANNAKVTVGANNNKLIGMDIIVTDGATLDISKCSQAYQLGENSRIIIMPGGKLIDNNNYRTVNSYSIDMQGELIYNAGTIDVKEINLNNGKEDGSISGLYNAKNGVIKANDIIMSNDKTVFTNWGKTEVNNIYGNGLGDWGQGTVNNGCLLRVKDTFRAAYLNQAANTAIECKTFRTNGNTTLRQGSIIRADELYCTLATYTYCGDNSQGALISVGNVKQFDDNNTMTGLIYFEVGEFTKISGGDVDWYQHQAEKAAPKGISAIGSAPVTVAADDNTDIAKAGCTGKGNTPTPEPTPTVTPQSWIIACEDLGSTDDYDFNDIVVKVSYVAGENGLKVTPLAAGGTLKAVISFPSLNNWSGEIHELLNPSLAGTESGSYPMLNTSGSGNLVDTNNLEYNVSEIPLGTPEAGFTLSNSDGEDNMGGFIITVSDENGAKTIKAPKTGAIPQMFVVPGTWAWPTERTSIKTAYPKFANWTTDTTEWNWFE